MTLFLYVDIETIPSQDPALVEEIFAKHVVPSLDESSIKPAANLTDPAKVAADLDKRLEKARADQHAAEEKAAQTIDAEYRKTALDATTGHVACISHALNDGTVVSHRNEALKRFATIQPDPDCIDLLSLADVVAGERKMLETFFINVEAAISQRQRNAAEELWDAHNPQQMENGSWMLTEPGKDGKWSRVSKSREAFVRENIRPRTPVVVAHHAQFDIRYIWQRAVILGVPVPDWWPINAKPWDTDRVDDTMLAWAGHGNRIGLDRLCRALGIEGKPDDIDGSKVWDAVREGRLDEVCSYCDGDVERLRSVHKRLRPQLVETTVVETWSNRNGRAEIVDRVVSEGGAA